MQCRKCPDSLLYEAVAHGGKSSPNYERLPIRVLFVLVVRRRRPCPGRPSRAAAANWGFSSPCGTSSPSAAPRSSPAAARSLTNCSSLFGCSLSSPSISSWSFRRMVSQATSSPSAPTVPPQKNRFSGKMPRGRLNPLVVHRPADGRHVDAHLVGDLLHLQRLDRLRALVEELGLVIDDRLGHPRERAAALLDRVDQPLGRIDLPLDVFPRLRRWPGRWRRACDSRG